MMYSKDIFHITDRLREALGLKSDTDLAGELGMTLGALRNHKTRRTIPYGQIAELCSRKGISMDWVLTGEGSIWKPDIHHYDDSVPGVENFSQRLQYLRENIFREGPEEFIHSLEITRQHLEELEAGTREPDGRFLTLLHSKYHGRVDLNWLLTGTSHFFAPPSESLPRAVAQQGSPYDDTLMKDVIETVEEIIREEGLSIPPEKK
ncbi:MAG: bacteriophage CI repressor, partial [candidate division Zixibacteria bacterium]|nr:bacteriophage CI repressor [Phycisphaerae bacterium]NIR63106.1 bacteriophage CI repressor [candidate division Zixibacteria bacterium]NIS45105.1 bacteriophage CI repressor [candidate division Zixibacteria bacterium]NIT53241.1 bacteriophage CI repressor [candidate division Zixibacteria bacterium]NIU13234.1 bacteriophage CI repressor [candidate division Zixibacteria bacterium]